MLIIPAIDLKDGCVVRYVQGRLNKKVYSKDPVKTAKYWVRQGAQIIHLVDLDGAMTGKPKNLEIVKQIIKAVDVPVQLGGGIRKIELIKNLLAYGISRVVLGTKAVEDKNFLQQARRNFKDKVIVSVDTERGQVLTCGWQIATGRIGTLSFIDILKKAGFKEMIYTDISKDGTLKGPNIKELKVLLKKTGMKIIASGGISSLNDIARLKLLEKSGIIGIIIGKALYEGRFTLSEAIKLR
ncbi:MAG: 1-(5-phosphoribosyl)-5-[(5-phosphoribosylamino)methylideneamino]imidazole-4-carboxamide isomerase [Omnitrophica WOR_2 bacterium RBG_13_41_10]|nr:MAG: 1-(5-phosphoribosyl)-5-[(5-phosphoribosylamino)methylideneamino]imidazole-4-carboxamide isomerase [Omnitrophica WOR_2 bacterium RBG_13_41_10]